MKYNDIKEHTIKYSVLQCFSIRIAYHNFNTIITNFFDFFAIFSNFVVILTSFPIFLLFYFLTVQKNRLSNNVAGGFYHKY